MKMKIKIKIKKNKEKDDTRKKHLLSILVGPRTFQHSHIHKTIIIQWKKQK